MNLAKTIGKASSRPRAPTELANDLSSHPFKGLLLLDLEWLLELSPQAS